MRFLKRLFVLLVVLYLLILVFVYVKQRSFIYFPDREPPPADFVQALDLSPFNIDVEGVGTIQSFYKEPAKDHPVILFFHGNGGSVYHRAAMLGQFKAWGFGFLAVEYPGYADNPGKPSETSIYRSALAHYDHLVVRGTNPKNIVLYGHSLGAASAVHVASERETRALVLTAPFLSAKAMGRHRMPYFPTGILLKDKFRSDLKMPRVDEPLTVLHGDQDQVIPHSMGKALSELHQGEKEFVTLPDDGHMLTMPIIENELKRALLQYQ